MTATITPATDAIAPIPAGRARGLGAARAGLGGLVGHGSAYGSDVRGSAPLAVGPTGDGTIGGSFGAARAIHVSCDIYLPGKVSWSTPLTLVAHRGRVDRRGAPSSAPWRTPSPRWARRCPHREAGPPEGDAQAQGDPQTDEAAEDPQADQGPEAAEVGRPVRASAGTAAPGARRWTPHRPSRPRRRGTPR